MTHTEFDNQAPSGQPVLRTAERVHGISGGVLALLLTLVLSFSTVCYGCMTVLYRVRYGHVEPFWYVADMIVPFLIFVLLCVGCWMVYIGGRKQSGKTAGFTLIGTALVIEIFHWLFAWAMSFVSNVVPFVNLLTGSDTTFPGISADDLALVFDIVFLAAGFFFIAALGVQMEVSVHRSVLVPAKTLLRGGDIPWRPSRLAVGMPVLFAVLLFATEETALMVLESFSEILPEMSGGELSPFPMTFMNLYLVAYTIVNILAVILVVRARRKGGKNDV